MLKNNNYTMILPVVLYGWETWSLTLREECRLRIFENRGEYLGPRRGENGEWIRLHNYEPHCLYRSPNIVRVIKSRRLRWSGHLGKVEEGRRAFKTLTGKLTGKRPLWRHWCRWEDTIKMALREIGINTSNWTALLKSSCEWGIETPGSISHRVS